MPLGTAVPSKRSVQFLPSPRAPCRLRSWCGDAWVKGIAQAANADHLLHVLDVPAQECKRRLHERNATRPDGLYFGDVSDELFDAVVQRIVPTRDDEVLQIARASG